MQTHTHFHTHSCTHAHSSVRPHWCRHFEVVGSLFTDANYQVGDLQKSSERGSFVGGGSSKRCNPNSSSSIHSPLCLYTITLQMKECFQLASPGRRACHLKSNKEAVPSFLLQLILWIIENDIFKAHGAHLSF